MNKFNFFLLCAISIIAHAHSIPSGYGAAPAAEAPADYAPADAAADAHAYGSPANYGSAPSYGSKQSIPYAPANTRGNTVTSSITYPQNKGEILIHRPAAIIVKRPPTKVLVNHPPLVVKPAPVVLHKPPAVVLRKVYVKHHPRPVKVEPVYVNVVKPPAEKYFVNEKQQLHAGYAPVNSVPNANAAASGGAAQSAADISSSLANLSAPADNIASNAGYQLLSSNQGLAALANIANAGSYGPAAPHAYDGSAPHAYAPAAPNPYAPAY